MGDLTYGELRASALRIGTAIRRRVAPQEPGRVALLLDRDASLPCGVFGTLLSGAAYVPLDPTYPEEYSAGLVSATGVGLIVTAGRHLELARAVGG